MQKGKKIELNILKNFQLHGHKPKLIQNKIKNDGRRMYNNSILKQSWGHDKYYDFATKLK